MATKNSATKKVNDNSKKPKGTPPQELKMALYSKHIANQRMDAKQVARDSYKAIQKNNKIAAGRKASDRKQSLIEQNKKSIKHY